MRPLPEDIEILITGDASPTLAFKRPDGYSERMHSAAGALSESLYIYSEALTLAMARPQPVHVLSFGLGLGYNELISVGRLAAIGSKDWKIYSFEAVPFLREEFRTWAEGGPPSALTEVTTTVAQMVARALDLDPDQLQCWTREALAQSRLELRGAFPGDASHVNSCNLVYYDAYSNKMDPALWFEEHFVGDLGPLLDPDCILSTYAATGALNRALKQLGFRLQPKRGFKGKRESTLAIRGPIR